MTATTFEKRACDQPRDALRSVDGGATLAAHPGFSISSILGAPIAMINPKAFVEIVSHWLGQRTAATPGIFINFRDVHGVVRALDEPALAEAHRQAFMNAPDGKPLAWTGRLRGYEVAQVCGPDSLPLICEAGLSQGWKHAFLGGTPAVLDALVANLKVAHPGLKVVQAVSPPFRPMSDEETQALIASLSDAKPDFLWVGLGCPKQELWMAQFAHRIAGAISLGVGAAFDFHAGTMQRAPLWVRRAGLEFLYRALQEPQRLGQRYVRVVPRFAFHVVREEVGHRVSRLRSAIMARVFSKQQRRS